MNQVGGREMKLNHKTVRLGAGFSGRMGWCGLVCCAVSAFGEVAPTRLELSAPAPNGGWVRLEGLSQSNRVLKLEASTNLSSWTGIGVFHYGLFDYPDVATRSHSRRFYR